ncbi:superoxide dismutase [Oceanobacillus halotolerans]|uniref:superoxide dismutase n=1 Tax=Oceanobacillus halotolerans TaxID=2663380 RepID=UPI0013DD1F5A|nr:superoxide dismutase [Oceanobacillus halotolerans]
MTVQKKEYLEELYKWGEEVKRTLNEANIPNNTHDTLVGQISQWQQKIKRLLEDEGHIQNDEVIALQKEGERYATDITTLHRKEKKQIGKHQLPPLPYKYNALEPYISEEIMRLHHQKHHQSYVDGLNKAEEAIYKKHHKMEDSMLKHWLREQAFHGSGHFLHSIFWKNMTPNSKKEAFGDIRMQIDKDFGSFTNFKNLFTKAASSVEGVGWATLVWLPDSKKLAIQTLEKHQLFHIATMIPLLVLDVWEHAYYLQYKNDKKEYIKNWWNIVNWEDVNNRFKKVKNTSN